MLSQYDSIKKALETNILSVMFSQSCMLTVHIYTFCSLQVHHGPAGAPGGDPPPRPGLHFGAHHRHHAHRLPLPPQADSHSATAPQRSLHVQEHVVSTAAFPRLSPKLP